MPSIQSSVPLVVGERQRDPEHLDGLRRAAAAGRARAAARGGPADDGRWGWGRAWTWRASLGEETRRGAKSRGVAPSIAAPSVTTCAAVTAPQPGPPSADHRGHGPGRPLPGRGAPRRGDRGRRGSSGPAGTRPLPGAVTEVPLVEADLLRPRRAAARGGRGGARRALPPRGADLRPRLVGGPDRDRRGDRRGDRDAARGRARPGAGARASGWRARARSSATRASRPSTSARRCARARPTAWPSSPPTASWGPCAATTGSSPARG